MTTEVDALRAEMAGVRGQIDESVQDIVENARNMADWRYYVKTVPLGFMAGALALGYFVVPRRVEIIRPDADEIAKLAKQHRIVVQSSAQAETKKSGPAQMVLTMLANAALRAGTAYVSQKAGKVLGEVTGQKSQEQYNAEVPQP